MDQYHADLAWLENPEVFAVNRLEAHSDHLNALFFTFL